MSFISYFTRRRTYRQIDKQVDKIQAETVIVVMNNDSYEYDVHEEFVDDGVESVTEAELNADTAWTRIALEGKVTLKPNGVDKYLLDNARKEVPVVRARILAEVYDKIKIPLNPVVSVVSG